MAPTGERMQSEGETLDLLLDTHFPDSDVVEGGGVHTAAHRATHGLAGGCQDHHLSQGGVDN